jgi:hypothetical protein
MQAGKRDLSVLQYFELHALGVLRDLPKLKLTRTETITATAPTGCFNEAKSVKVALEGKKAEARYQAQRLLTHPR